ncbi:MAG: efflux RND transporter permease subunit, partial [Nannocystaceae bacterium]
MPGADEPGVPGPRGNLRSAVQRLEFTVRRPVAVLMVFLAVMVFGGFSARLLPVNLMPEISYPKLTVRTEYPGAAPAEVENDVARPLEEQLGVVTGLTTLSSVSTSGNCDVVLEFTWDTDMDDANQNVLEKLDLVVPSLPDGTNQPLILRYDPSLDPVMVLSLSGSGERFEGVGGLKYLRRISERSIKRLLEPVDGVAAVKVKGGLLEEIRVELDEQALRRTGIAITEVTSRLTAENVNVAGGAMREGNTRYLIRTVNEFESLDNIRDLVIASRQGREIRLRDLARVTSTYEDREVVTRVDGDDAIQIEIYKEAEANIVDMAARVRGRLEGGRGGRGVIERMEREHGAKLQVVSDRSLFIESSIREVLNTALLGGLVAVFVLFFFLGHGTTTAIVGLAIPMSVIVTFAPLNLAGVSMNIMSLGGLALGIGMLVDNAIVVLESIYRCREEGDDPTTATLRGTAEVGSAVAASTLTSIAVFFPMVFVEGIAGQLFGDLGLTVVFSLLASLAVALFFIPMISSRRWAQPGVDLGGERGSFFADLWGVLVPRSAVESLVADLRGSASKGRLALLSPYLLLRTIGHLILEIPARLLWVCFMIVFRIFAMAFGGLLWVLSTVLRPAVRVFGRSIDATTRVYRGVVRGSVRRPGSVLAVVFGVLAVTWMAAYRLDTELVPELHQGELSVEMALPVGTPLDVTDATTKRVESRLGERLHRVRAMVSTVGTERDDVDEGERGEHTSTISVSLYAGQGQQRAATLRRSSEDDGESADRATDEDDPWTAACGSSDASAICIEQLALEEIRAVTSVVPGLQTSVRRPA